MMRFFSSPPQHPDQLWGLPSLLSNGYGGALPQRSSGWGMKLTAHLHLAPRLRTCRAILPLPQYIFMTWWLLKRYVFMVWYFVKHRNNFNFTFQTPEVSGRIMLKGWKIILTQSFETCSMRKKEC
jgi:hypothetical protein